MEKTLKPIFGWEEIELLSGGLDPGSRFTSAIACRMVIESGKACPEPISLIVWLSSGDCPGCLLEVCFEVHLQNNVLPDNKIPTGSTKTRTQVQFRWPSNR